MFPQGLLEDLEGNLKTLETKLYAEGTDAATVGKIVEDKEATETRVAKLYQEVRWYSMLLAVVFIREVRAAAASRGVGRLI